MTVAENVHLESDKEMLCYGQYLFIEIFIVAEV